MMLDLAKVAENAREGESAARVWSSGPTDGSRDFREICASCLVKVSEAVAKLSKERCPENARALRPKILIVDDSEIVCDSVSSMLEPRGYDVVSLTSLFAFTQTLAAERPDLVLVDVSMPALNGDKLIEISRKHHDNIYKMVLFSNRAETELSSLAARCGAAGYIQKTGDAERLAREVATFLHNPR